MNDIWVLSIKTSFFAFDSFEKARGMLRAKLREFALQKIVCSMVKDILSISVNISLG